MISFTAQPPRSRDFHPKLPILQFGHFAPISPMTPKADYLSEALTAVARSRLQWRSIGGMVSLTARKLIRGHFDNCAVQPLGLV